MQVYLDWANHYLKKGGYSDTISDLKDIADGQYLPKVIHAVGMLDRLDMAYAHVRYFHAADAPCVCIHKYCVCVGTGGG